MLAITITFILAGGFNLVDLAARSFGLSSITTGLLLAGFLLIFAVVSLTEQEPRAARRAFLLALLLPMPYLVVGAAGLFYQTTTLAVAAVVLLVATALAALALFLPLGVSRASSRLSLEDDAPQGRIDERDIMFSRRLLKEGSERYEAYYRRNPEKKALDEKFRNRPGRTPVCHCDEYAQLSLARVVYSTTTLCSAEGAISR